MAIETNEALLDAIVAYFQTALADSDFTFTVKKGWPDGEAPLELETGPVLTVTLVSSETELCSPADVGVDGSTVTYRVGYLTSRVQLDLWTAYRAQREDAGFEVQQALHNQLPHTTGLWLASSGYFDRPISIDITGTRTFDEGSDPAAVGEWRCMWDLEALTDLVNQVDHPTQTEVEVQMDVDDVDYTFTVSE